MLPCWPFSTFQPTKYGKCIKTFQKNFCHFRCQFENFSNFRTAIIFFKTTGQLTRYLLTLSNISIHAVCRNFNKRPIKTFKVGISWFFVIFGAILRLYVNNLRFCKISPFWGQFWVIMGSTKKIQKSPQKHRTKLASCELNSMGNTLQVKYKFGAWLILLKKSFDLNIFLSHMEYGRKMTILNLINTFTYHDWPSR